MRVEDDSDDIETGSGGQPQRRHVKVGERVPMAATTGARSVFHQPGTASVPGQRGGLVKPLPVLDIAAMRPVVMPKPARPKPPYQKGSRYDALFEGLQPGQMHLIDDAYRQTVRRVMVRHNKAGPCQYSLRSLNGGKFGLWRDK